MFIDFFKGGGETSISRLPYTRQPEMEPATLTMLQPAEPQGRPLFLDSVFTTLKTNGS